MKQQTRIFTGVALGIVVGGLVKLPGGDGARHFIIALEPLGTVFIRLVTMVVVPLVIASVFVGVASLGDIRSLGRIGGKTLLFFLATTVAAAVIGLVAARVTNVGMGLSPLDRDALVSRFGDQSAGATVQGAKP